MAKVLMDDIFFRSKVVKKSPKDNAKGLPKGQNGNSEQIALGGRSVNRLCDSLGGAKMSEFYTKLNFSLIFMILI
jgi:hypothetical protein